MGRYPFLGIQYNRNFWPNDQYLLSLTREVSDYDECWSNYKKRLACCDDKFYWEPNFNMPALWCRQVWIQETVYVKLRWK